MLRMKHQLACKTSIRLCGRPVSAIVFAIGIYACGLSNLGRALEPAIPKIEESIYFRGEGDYHVYKAIEAAGAENGLTCRPTVKDYEQGHMVGRSAHGTQVIRRPNSMQCRFGTVGSITARTTDKGIIRIAAYYDTDVPAINRVMSKVQSAAGNDPLCRVSDLRVRD